MSSLPLMRTEYWNLSTGTVRSGATGHGESLTDVENYLLPQAQIQGSSLLLWGVAEGLTVTAVPNQADLSIAPGVALDAAGRLIALAASGVAITDPTVDPHQVQNIPTVPVDASGVVLSTAGLSGDCVLTLTWREVLGQSQLANAPVLIHAPWLRLLGVAGFQDTGEQVILAQVTLDGAGLVTALAVTDRRLVGLPAGRLELRRPRAVAGPPFSVDHLAAGELRARPEGGLEINLLPAGGPPQPVLTVEAPTGNLALAPQGGNVGIGTATPSAGLYIDRGATDNLALTLASSGPGWGSGLQLSNKAAGAKTYGTYAGSDGKWHFVDQTSQADRLVIDQSGNLGIGASLSIGANLGIGGNLGIGIGANQAKRKLHVEGTEIHSGGPGGGFSFMNRGTQGFVETPAAGERWVWFAQGGTARLWSGVDRLTISPTGEGGGLDVPRRMRVRQGNDSSAGIWFFQTAPQKDRAFVGMVNDNHVGFWGNNAGWGLRMNISNGNVAIGNSDTPKDKLEVVGATRLGSDANPIRFTSGWSGFPDSATNQAEISNDTGTYKTLMIVGNKSAGGGRKVSIWDRLEVNGQSCAQSFCNLSDGRLKTDVAVLDTPLDRVAQLRGVSFRWQPGVAAAGAAGGIGVIAQNVAEVFPELVSTMGPQQHLAVDYSGLTAVLLEAVKELKAKNERLRRRVDALEEQGSAEAAHSPVRGGGTSDVR